MYRLQYYTILKAIRAGVGLGLGTRLLKNEMREKPMSTVTPIIGIVYLREGEAFNENHASSYSYETMGGNHSRIALQEDYPPPPHTHTPHSHTPLPLGGT